MAAPSAYDLKSNFFEETDQFLGPSIAGGVSYRDLLNTDQFKRRRDATILEAKFNNFPNPLHERVEVFRLSVAAAQRRNGGDIIAVFIAFDDNSEPSLSLHKAILAL